MNTQYEKNSIYLAKMNYLMKRREKELKTRLMLFFAGLCLICGGICAILGNIAPV